MTRKKLRDRVIVVTGASSGIGRATARRLAERGATVVLAARNAEALREVAAECDNAGGRGIAVPTDVTEAAAVETLARRAVAEGGRIDAWVNNAGVYLLGPFQDLPASDIRRVLDVNVMGVVHGSKAALDQFTEQHEGVLVNVGSMLSAVPAPYTSAYTMSKHAVRALSDCLRTELLDEPDIHVATVLPAGVDTPLFSHTANYTGRSAKPPRPFVDVEDVAAAIVDMVTDPERERFVGQAGRVSVVAKALAGGSTERALGRMIHREQFTEDVVGPTSGNLHAPSRPPLEERGGWGPSRRRRRGRRAVLAVGALGAAAAVAARRDGA